MNIITLDDDEQLTEPGAYLMPERRYRDDPCIDASFTQSLGKIFINQSPKHARLASPRLNPEYREDFDTKFAIGNVAHRLLLGRGKGFRVFESKDWNASGEGTGGKTRLHAMRDLARGAGEVPILRHQYDQAMVMVEAARKQIASIGSQFVSNAFAEGCGEVCLAWVEETFWLRSLVDWIEPGFCVVDDYKTTETSAAPHNLDKLADNAGWDIQAAMIERGLDRLDPDNSGRREFRFFAQEAYEPYALTVGVMSEAAMTMGRKKLQYAIDLWKRCMTTGQWPGYEPAVVTVGVPQWSEARWLDREEEAESQKFNELARRKDEGELVGGMARGIHNLMAG